MSCAHVDASDVVALGLPMYVDDLAYGYEREWLSGESVIALATEQLRHGDLDPLIDELAMLLSDEVSRAHDLMVEAISPGRVRDPRESARKWLFIMLRLAYDRRAELADPLGSVEEIYAAFDYPESVEAFVRYMPPGANEEIGLDALMARWADYLEAEMSALGNQGRVGP